MSFNPDNLPYMQKREDIKNDPAKFGEAVYTFMQQKPEPMEVGDLMPEITKKYMEGLREAAQEGSKIYDSPFHIIVFIKKEPTSNNNIRCWYVKRQTRPSPKVMRMDYPLHAHDVWKYDYNTGNAEFLWTLPTKADCNNILKNRDMYDEKLVNDILRFERGLLH